MAEEFKNLSGPYKERLGKATQDEIETEVLACAVDKRRRKADMDEDQTVIDARAALKEAEAPYKEDIKILQEKIDYCAQVARNNGWACESQMSDQMALLDDEGRAAAKSIRESIKNGEVSMKSPDGTVIDKDTIGGGA